MNLISYEKLTKYTKELEDKLTTAGKQYDQMVNVADGLMEELERYKAYARDMNEERDLYKARLQEQENLFTTLTSNKLALKFWKEKEQELNEYKRRISDQNLKVDRQEFHIATLKDDYKNCVSDRDRLAIEFANYIMGNAPRDYEGELHHFKLVIYKK